MKPFSPVPGAALVFDRQTTRLQFDSLADPELNSELSSRNVRQLPASPGVWTGPSASVNTNWVFVDRMLSWNLKQTTVIVGRVYEFLAIV